MTREEMVAVLARCASFDRRTVGKTDVTSWLLALGDLTHTECDAAVIEYYRSSREWIMPSDIRQRVLNARNEWLQQHPDFGPRHPEIVPPWIGVRALESGS